LRTNFRKGLTSYLPKSKDEFVEWCIYDPAFFIQVCCQISVKGLGEVPFIFNTIQQRHHDAIYDYSTAGVPTCREHDVIILKTRQYGQTTYEIADGFHSFCFRKAYMFKVVTYADSTAAKIKKIANLLYKSSHDFFESLGIDSEVALPYVRGLDNQHEMYGNKTGSLIEFTSAGSKGEGRGLTVNRVYFTEYPEYDHPDEVLSGIIGSVAQDAEVRVTKDGTGSGVGTVFYREYQAAKEGESGERAFFYGRNDFEYPDGFLEKQRSRLGARRFKREYPKDDEEAFLKAENTRFDAEAINASAFMPDGSAARYLVDVLGLEAVGEMIHAHGVDCAEGVPTGNYSTISTFGLKANHESCEPYREKSTPRETAFAIRARCERYPGIFCIERNNHGHAVILKCCDLKLRSGFFMGHNLSDFLYVHESVDSGKKHERGRQSARSQYRYGWPQTKDNKTLIETEMEIVLDDHSITIVSENGRRELREYQRHDDGSFGAPKSSRNADEDARFYDDEAISLMLAQMAREQAARLSITHRQSGFAGVGSNRDYDL
jgi:hypothetical protein